MKCPHCGSEDVQFVTSSSRAAPSFMNGCCGLVFLGPVGLLCSFCGTGTKKEEYWICKKCATKFQFGDYEKNLKNKEKSVISLKRDLEQLSNHIEGTDEEKLNTDVEQAKDEYDVAERKENEFYNAIMSNYKGVKTYKTIENILNFIAFLILSIVVIFVLIAWGSSNSNSHSLFTVILGSIVFFIPFLIVSVVLMCLGEYLYERKLNRECPEEAEQLKMYENETKLKKANYDELIDIQNKIKEYKTKSKELTYSQEELDNYKDNDK